METARLVLRELSEADVPALARELGNFKISRHTCSIPYPYNYSDAVEFVARQKAKPTASVKKVIAHKSTPDELIGSVRLHVNMAENTCELGYWLAESQWGHGYGTEAAAAIVEHAFSQLKYAFILASYDDDNPASGRVLAKLGFSEIGKCKEFSLAQGKFVPGTRVMLTPEQWQTNSRLS